MHDKTSAKNSTDKLAECEVAPRLLARMIRRPLIALAAACIG